ncbi:hypothetical protein A2U01_0089992, partial [Trifolium medium]|nr:hypothetical protein [Trifolium medium]
QCYAALGIFASGSCAMRGVVGATRGRWCGCPVLFLVLAQRACGAAQRAEFSV